jgi:hypothetical protein
MRSTLTFLTALLLAVVAPALAHAGGKASSGKIIVCHATHSATNPYVMISISQNGLNGHDLANGDFIPASGATDCSQPQSSGGGDTGGTTGGTTDPGTGGTTTPPSTCDAPTNFAPPVASGTVLPGNVLTSTPGSWGGTNITGAYQWQESADQVTWTDIPGAIASSYTVDVTDAGLYMRLMVTVTNSCGSLSVPSNTLSPGV